MLPSARYRNLSLLLLLLSLSGSESARLHMDGCRQLAAEKAQLSHTLAALVAHDHDDDDDNEDNGGDGRNFNDPPPNATNITLNSAAPGRWDGVERGGCPRRRRFTVCGDIISSRVLCVHECPPPSPLPSSQHTQRLDDDEHSGEEKITHITQSIHLARTRTGPGGIVCECWCWIAFCDA